MIQILYCRLLRVHVVFLRLNTDATPKDIPNSMTF